MSAVSSSADSAAASRLFLPPLNQQVDAALDAGARIALLATFLPTVGMMKAEVEAGAKERNLSPTIEARHVPGALEALQAGRAEEHDALIAKVAAELPPVDALVLAQFSMTRAARDRTGRWPPDDHHARQRDRQAEGAARRQGRGGLAAARTKPC